MAKGKSSDIVTVICYNQKETMTRKQAIDKYKEGAMMCEGSEGERYSNIYFQLIEGKKVCSDQVCY